MPADATIRAEQAVLGSMLRDPRCSGLVIGHLTRADFATPRHREIFAILADLDVSKLGSTDAVTVAAEIERRGKTEELGGRAYLMELMDAVPSIAFLENHVTTVSLEAKRRRLGDLVRIAQQKLEGAYGTDEIARGLDKGITDLLASDRSQAPVSIQQAAAGLQKDLERRAQLDQPQGVIPAPFSALTTKLDGGFYPGELIVVGARPAMGKTMFAECAAEVASQYGQALYVSLEMGADQLAERAIRRHMNANVPLFRGLYGPLAEQARTHIQTPVRIINTQRVSYLDHPETDFSKIRSQAIRMRREGGLALLIVDYLQLIPVPDTSGSRQEDIASLSRRLKLLARELRVPTLALSQLNRGSEKRDGKLPSLSDLRESGAIEQDADRVLLLHRPGYYEKHDGNSPDQVIVAKNRSGESGTVQARCNLTRLRWADYVREAVI